MDKLESIGPESICQFDAFPKLPSTYKTRTQGGGFLTLFVAVLSFLLVINDIAEYIWGWPDYEFNVDKDGGSFMNVNVDLVVNTPCRHLSVDLRDALGDRLHLSEGFKRDGVSFDVSQATKLKAHSAMLSARQAVAQSRRSRGFFSFWRSSAPTFRPTYNHEPDASACRVYGSLEIKKVTANLHITTLGHGYTSYEHTDHNVMNMSHVITEFSFGPYFPDITQPLDYSFEVTDEHFMAYQYFLTVVPTTFIAPRTAPLRTHQYSVTHYERVMEHNKGTPGIFFKFDLEPLALSIHQRTTTLVQLMIRCVGVIGGVWVCTGWAVKVSSKVGEVVTGPDKTPGIVAAEATGVKKRWGGGDLRSRANAGSSGYSSYPGTPLSATFSQVGSPARFPPSQPSSPLPPPPSSAGFPPPPGVGSPYSSPQPHPTSPFPPSPLPGASGFPSSPNPRQVTFPPSPDTRRASFPLSPTPGQGSVPLSPVSPGAPPSGAGYGQARRSLSGLRNTSGGSDEEPKVD